MYRSDYLNLSAVLPAALAETVAARPDLAEPLAIVAAAVEAGGEAAVRLQQLCGAATAKSMEDCLFYRDPRLVSLNEVGGEPEWFGVSAAEFHQRRAVARSVVAAGDDDVDARTTPSAARTSAPGSGCCPRCRRCGRSSSAHGSDGPRRPTR